MACMDRDDLNVFMFQVICFSVVLPLDAYDHQMLKEPWQSQCLTNHGRSNVTYNTLACVHTVLSGQFLASAISRCPGQQ